MSTNTQGSGFKGEKHHNSNSKAKGPGSNSSGNGSTNNTFTNQIPRKPVGYTFNNGSEKQPVVRAQEFDGEGMQKCTTEGDGVGLNFNYWMDHSYIVDQQICKLITGFLCPESTTNAMRSKAIARDCLTDVNNLVILSVQGVDPRELNDTIHNLPFLSKTTSMPIRHLHESSPPLTSFEDTAFAAGSSEQLWQYLDVANQNAKMLWTDKPSVLLASLANTSTVELLTKYTLTFTVRLIHKCFTLRSPVCRSLDANVN